MRFSIALIAIAALGATGCQNSQRHYSLKGQLLSKDVSGNQVNVDTESIPGFMPAMTMIYPVKDPQGFAQVQPGDKITADVVVENSGATYWLEHVTTTDKSARPFFATVKRPHAPVLNKKVPDVAFVNQDGKTMHLADLKGKAVLVTFIYTRCPSPNFCPLMSSRFARIHKDLATDPALGAKTHLVSVTLDPVYDKPPVLRNYGLSYLNDGEKGFAGWDFVASSPGDLKSLASAFGLQYFDQNKQIAHSLSTILIDPDGTVKQVWTGSDWKTADVFAALKNAAS